VKKRVFVIGDRDTVLGFSLIGIRGFATDNASDATKKINDLSQDPDTGLILITAGLANKMRETLLTLKQTGRLPVVLEISDSRTKPERVMTKEMLLRTLGVRV